MTGSSEGNRSALEGREVALRPEQPVPQIRRVFLIDLPRMSYHEALKLQTAAVAQCVRYGGPEALIVLEHPPTITLGTRGDESDLLVSVKEVARRGIALHRVDRGGAATWHGPGQVVCYPIVRLRPLKLTVRAYVHGLEETVIQALGRFGVTGIRLPKQPGVWVGQREKIASVGVKIARGVTYHGFSLNVDLVTDPCSLVVSCGMSQVRMVSLSDLIGPVDDRLVRDALVQCFAAVFNVQVHMISPAELLAAPRDS